MRYIYLFCLFALFSHFSFSQAYMAHLEYPSATKKWSSVAAFPGGSKALTAFFQKELQYPQQALENNTEGKVVISLIIDQKGHINTAKVTNSLGAGCDEEALRLVKLMPDWKPTIKDGKKISSKVNLNVVFRLK